MTSEFEEVPKWVEEFDVDDAAEGQWLVNYLTNKGIKLYRQQNENIREAAKRILIGLFRENRPDHYRLLRNIQESYRQRSKRKDKTEYLDRTYRLSRESVEKLNGLSDKLGVSKEQVVEALLKEQANLESLYDLKNKKGAKLTSDQIARSYAKHNHVGDLIFGSRAFPTEEQLVQTIKKVVKKLNISINLRKDKKPLLATSEFVRVMAKEGALYNVNSSLANSDSFDRVKDPISNEPLSDYSDDLMLEDFIYLSDTVEARLKQYRAAVYKSNGIRSEEALIETLVDEAYNWYSEMLELNSLRDESDNLRAKISQHRAELAKQIRDIKFDDERFDAIVKLCETLELMVIRLFEEYDLERHNHRINVETLKGNAPIKQPNRFRHMERDKSIKKFREMVALAIAGNVDPESVQDHEFQGVRDESN
ncbi:hypothetical protein [Idiomarina baltica]|uniref:Uncharacterized protein n=1 Tax=Idiomarina baltica OS145 TaxID=314276 RepID=A0ABM9WLL0_9GAMM|nr:hypothetical protein [Idiomarina baltica]EAQ31755.1 hypothetical protein OS145_06624 [Idiomarina baltica OS145]